METGLVGKYVIVRCKDAGCHAGILLAHEGREALLRDSRRLWRFLPANGTAYLSGVATEGLADGQVGVEVPLILLTEDCEIIECTSRAEESIRSFPAYVPPEFDDGDGDDDEGDEGDEDEWEILP